MKKLLGFLLVFMLLCIPTNLEAKNYNYSDNFTTIIFRDEVYNATGKADYMTSYGCKSKYCFSQLTIHGKTYTSNKGYQTSYIKKSNVSIDNNHKHKYWIDG